MEEIITIEKWNANEFTSAVNNKIKEGFTVSSTSCGIHEESLAYKGTFYQAILIKRGTDSEFKKLGL